jgi:hypothetical protein
MKPKKSDLLEFAGDGFPFRVVRSNMDPAKGFLYFNQDGPPSCRVLFTEEGWTIDFTSWKPYTLPASDRKSGPAPKEKMKPAAWMGHLPIPTKPDSFVPPLGRWRDLTPPGFEGNYRDMVRNQFPSPWYGEVE